LIVSVIAIACGLPIAFNRPPVFVKTVRDDCGNAPKFEADVK
jgi:hypothetical protein